MKKILCLFLILGLVIAMTGCKKKGKKKDENIDKVMEYNEYVDNLVSFEIEEEPKGILEVDSNYESCLKNKPFHIIKSKRIYHENCSDYRCQPRDRPENL